jgi:hypothetical protein
MQDGRGTREGLSAGIPEHLSSHGIVDVVVGGSQGRPKDVYGRWCHNPSYERWDERDMEGSRSILLGADRDFNVMHT